MAMGAELQDVALVREGRPVFAGLSLRLDERRIGLVGRNGSGKSTLLRLLAGLQAPDSGTVLVAGADMARDRRAAIRSVGILFQNPDHQIIFPTVEEELAFGLEQLGQPRPEARAAVATLLAAQGLTAWVGRSTASLSQGQRQLLCLLAVLAMRPGLLLLDEPYTGLDLPTALRLQRRLAGLEQQVILATHQPETLAGFERVIWLEAGQVAMDGAAGPVLEAYRAEMERLAGDAGC